MSSDGGGGHVSSLLEVEDLVVRYPVPRGIVGTITRAPAETVHAVDGVSFGLAAGELVALVGESVRAGVLSLLDSLKRSGLAILMITHDLSTAARFADRIAVMYLGRIVEEGPAAEVVRSPQHPYTRALLSVVPRRDPRDRQRGQILKGETPDAVFIPTGCR